MKKHNNSLFYFYSVFSVILLFTFQTKATCQENSLKYFVISDHQKIRQTQRNLIHDDNIFDSESGTIKISGAKNETVAFQIILQSEVDVSGVKINITDLKSSSDLIPSNNVSTYFQWYLFSPNVTAKMVALPKGFYPDPLIPFDDPYIKNRKIVTDFSVKTKKNQGIWFDIKIPANSASGNFLGKIEVSFNSQKEEIPIELQVLDFKIPQEWHTQVWIPMYWERFAQQENLNVNYFYKNKNKALVYRYYKMAFNHGFWTQFSNGVEQPRISWNENTGKINRIDWNDFDQFFSPILNGKLFDGQKPKIWKVGGWVFWGTRPGEKPNFGGNYRTDTKLTSKHKTALAEYCNEVLNHFSEKGWTDSKLFMYMIDEPDYKSFPNLPQLVSDYGQAIQKASQNKIQHLVTVAPFQSNLDDSGVDIYGTAACVLWPKTVNRLQKKGKEFWVYQYHEPFIGGHGLNHDAFGFLSWPWIAKRYKLDGLFYWVANFWPDNEVYKNAVNWNSSEISNGILFYPGQQLPSIGFPKIDGPVSSLRMKTLRRGLLDMEYVWLAQQKDPQKTEAIVEKIVNSALNEGGFNPYWNIPKWGKKGDWSHNPKDYFNARKELTKIILAN